MGQEVHLQTSLYELYWYPMEQGYGSEYAALFNSFMRDYLSVKTGTIPRIDMVYDAFKAYVIGGKAPDTISEVVKDIYTYPDITSTWILHKEPDKLLCGAFKTHSQLRVDVSYPCFYYRCTTIMSTKLSAGTSSTKLFVWLRIMCSDVPFAAYRQIA